MHMAYPSNAARTTASCPGPLAMHVNSLSFEGTGSAEEEEEALAAPPPLDGALALDRTVPAERGTGTRPSVVTHAALISCSMTGLELLKGRAQEQTAATNTEHGSSMEAHRSNSKNSHYECYIQPYLALRDTLCST